MILTVLLPYTRPTPAVAGTAAVVSMLSAESTVRLTAVRYGTPQSDVERLRLDATDEYLRVLGWHVRSEVGTEYLSDVWNLGALLARTHADMTNAETATGRYVDSDPEAWGLIVVDPTVLLSVDALPDLADALEDHALVYDDPGYIEGNESTTAVLHDPAVFDGRLFGFAHPDAGVLLTRHDHTDPATCGADLLANLDAEADVLALPTGSGRL